MIEIEDDEWEIGFRLLRHLDSIETADGTAPGWIVVDELLCSRSRVDQGGDRLPAAECLGVLQLIGSSGHGVENQCGG